MLISLNWLGTARGTAIRDGLLLFNININTNMKTFNEFLFEARRNPEQNPKISAYDALEKYKDDEDIYISFTGVDKIGINPHSPYNTPISIYSYPLKEIFKEFNHKQRHVEVPFAGKAPYIWVIRQTKEKFVKDLYTEYTSADFDRDMAKLDQLYGKDIGVVDTVIVKYSLKIAKIIINQTGQNNSDIQMLSDWSQQIRKILNDESIEWEDFVDGMNGYFGGLDHWEPLERTPYSRFNSSGVIKAIINNYNREFDDSIQGIVRTSIKNAAVKGPAGSFWYVTGELSSMLAGPGTFEDTQKKMANRDVIKWNSVFRALGYSGFADKSGKGIIHPSEPTQAIFVDKSAFTVVEKVMNVNPKMVIYTSKEMMNNLERITIRDTIKTIGDEMILISPTLANGDQVTIKDFKRLIRNKHIMKFGFQIGDTESTKLLMPEYLMKYADKLNDKDFAFITKHFDSASVLFGDDMNVWFKAYKVPKKTQEKLNAMFDV